MYRQRFKCEREIVWYKQKGKLKLGIIKKTIYVLWIEKKKKTL